jgi:pimeloyl-ACP methyl ester carboxylesterase
MHTSRLVNRLSAALISALVLALSGCGGGGGSSTPAVTPTITGLAATGAAIANAPVSAKCTAGVEVSGTTAADGTFTLTLSGGQTFPCMVQVTNGTVKFHSFAAAAGHINVTPLTELVIAKALGSNPENAYTSFDANTGSTIANGLADAKTYVDTEVKALTGTAPAGDVITETFKIGDSEDKLLEDAQAKVGNASISDIRFAAQEGDSLDGSQDRGTLVSTDPPSLIGTLTASTIDAQTAASGLNALSGAAQCDVSIWQLDYNTIGVKGEATNASAALLVPSNCKNGTNGASNGDLIAYAKGTDVQQPRTLASLTDPETFSLVAMFASQGYAVVATDYLGFAKSTYEYNGYPFHPYLHAASEASSIIDSIRAARNAASASMVNMTLSGKVMVTGYSQGGHSSMAAQRAIEDDYSDEINLVAGAHLAGPYNLSGAFRDPTINSSTVAIAGYQFFVPYIITSWQKAYGNVYTNVTDVFQDPYASFGNGIENLLPSTTLNYSTLISSGALPGANGETPAQARDELMQPTFLTDVQNNDNNGLYIDAKKNDLLDWTPKAPVLLCGGKYDPTVPPSVHMDVLMAKFTAEGLTSPQVQSVDVDPYIQATYGVLASPTATTKTMPDPSNAAYATYMASYHGSYEPPFCEQAAKKLFDTVK